MKQYIFFAVFSFCCGISICNAQPKYYLVQLKNKDNNSFTTSNPSVFLSSKAIERRAKHHIPIDVTDLPCTPMYVDSIKTAGNITVHTISKWFNQVTIQTADADAIKKIKAFSFVSNVIPIDAKISKPVNKFLELPDKEEAKILQPQKNNSIELQNDFFSYGQSADQIHLHNGEFLHNHGFRGEGITFCITDGGFFHYETLPTFDSVRNNNQILGTWDFVANDTSVNEDHPHGMQCFSTIAANMPDVFVGSAPKAFYYLFRTEDAATEMPIEEQNWVAAIEKADELGVDICSVSLGYTTFDNPMFNHTYNDMNGNTTVIANAADIAAKKGMIVVVAAGNSGSDAWHYISTPADADSILAVGAVNKNRQVASFSSYGPSSDGQIKPDVAALGVNAIIASPANGQPIFGNGTSFACPNMAGLTACLWQAFPEVNNMTIIAALRESADKYSSPDDRTGYGIPDIKKAFVILIKKLFTQNMAIADCKTNISFSVKCDTSATITLQRKLPVENDYSDLQTLYGDNNFALKNFLYEDDLSNLLAGEIKYRIKMDIASDTTFYLDPATINLLQDCNPNAEEKIAIGPNPVTSNLKILVTRNQAVNVKISIHNSIGQQVYSSNDQQITNSHQYSIPFEKLSKDIYVVRIFIDGKKVATKKIVRQ